jgi:hypothetical protein
MAEATDDSREVDKDTIIVFDIDVAWAGKKVPMAACAIEVIKVV